MNEPKSFPTLYRALYAWKGVPCIWSLRPLLYIFWGMIVWNELNVAAVCSTV